MGQLRWFKQIVVVVFVVGAKRLVVVVPGNVGTVLFQFVIFVVVFVVLLR